jgi:hypothetical protein
LQKKESEYKVAYIFVGHVRTWNQCYQNFFDNIFSVLPGDIFIHTWDTTNPSFGSWWAGYREFTDEEKGISNQTPDFNSIFDIYKPKVLLIERDNSNYMNNESAYIKSSYGVKNVLNASRKIFEIASSYDNYDIFFLTRMDIKYTSKFDISEIQIDKLMTPDITTPKDIWMYGNREVVDIKTKYAHYVQEYWLDFGTNIWPSYWFEHALGKYLKDNNIQLGESKLKYDTIRLF